MFLLLLCVGTALEALGMIRSVEWAVETGLAGLSERSVQEPGSLGSWGAAVLKTSEGPLGQGSCRLSAVRLALGLGLEEGGAGNVELALIQSGLRAIYSRTLGVSRAFPQGAEQLWVCERWPVGGTQLIEPILDVCPLGHLWRFPSPCSRSPPCSSNPDLCPVTLRFKCCSMLSLWLNL